MTERRDFKEYLREQIKASETTAAEAYREAADLILSSGHQAAFEKRHYSSYSNQGLYCGNDGYVSQK